MRIAVIGAGYVGLITGVCLAELGHQVTCVDVNKSKIQQLSKGVCPIHEQGLEELIRKNIRQHRLSFTTMYEVGLTDSQLVFIAVGTPEANDGSADLSYVKQAASAIAQHLQQDTVVITKSTVPVGTNERIQGWIEKEAPRDIAVHVVANPEFLRQGSAVEDAFRGDRIVLGAQNPTAMNVVAEIYKPLNIPILKTDFRSAEMIKYTANAFLAMKISFINEISHVAEQCDANIEEIAKGVGMDKRIGSSFLRAGIGYGGSCLPKDTKALLAIGKKAGQKMRIIEQVQRVNELQRVWLIEKILQRFGNLDGKTIALLGLAFKPNTDDMRQSPAIEIAQMLINIGATVHAYDPVALENAKEVMPRQVRMMTTMEETLRQAHCAVILTDWQEIKAFPLENYHHYLISPILFDGRNCFSLTAVKQAGLEYHSIGRPDIFPISEAVQAYPE
ncbi:UDP-glucose dehydrogenase family protein [Virgibacillus sp. MG-45]|uniref:UDP-glucose dehydrogenase family protein n=1 Tax=Virgibacillus sp. MG-45 TaxID=3102791 RepID=UPI002ED953B5